MAPKARLIAALLLAATTAFAGKDHAATVSPFPTPPTIDGQLDPGEWTAAVRTTGFQTLNRPRLSPRDGASYCGFTAERLYLAVVSELPQDGELLANRKYRDADVVFDDSIEIWAVATTTSSSATARA